MFQCTKCGLCCRNLKNSDLYKDLDNGNGICIHLDTETNLCKIYNNRPEKCNIEQSYKFFINIMTKDEYYQLNYNACKKLNC